MVILGGAMAEESPHGECDAFTIYDNITSQSAVGITGQVGWWSTLQVSAAFIGDLA